MGSARWAGKGTRRIQVRVPWPGIRHPARNRRTIGLSTIRWPPAGDLSSKGHCATKFRPAAADTRIRGELRAAQPADASRRTGRITAATRRSEPKAVGFAADPRNPARGRAALKASLSPRIPSGAGAGVAGAVGIDVKRTRRPLDHLTRDHHLLDAFEAGEIEHGVEQDALHDGTQPARAGLALDRLAGDGVVGLVREREVDALHLEQPLVLFHQRILRLGEDALEGDLVEVLEGGDDRQAADEFGYQAVLEQVLGLDLAEDLALLAVLRRRNLGGKADGGRLAARRDDLLQAGERAAAHEQDARGVDLQELLLRVLAAALRRHGSDRAFHDLQQRLLHAFARHVAGDRRVVGLAADLVDLVDIDDAALGALHVVVGRLQQLEDDVLDVLADIAGLGQRGGVGHGERHVEDAGERLRQQRLAGAGRPDQQDVRLGQFDVIVLGLVVEPLVVVVDGDRQDLLGVILTDHVVVQDLADFLRRRDAVARLHQRGLVLLAEYIHAQFHALVADEHGRAGNELAHLVLALATERAVERVLRVAADLAHRVDLATLATAGPGPRA